MRTFVLSLLMMIFALPVSAAPTELSIEHTLPAAVIDAIAAESQMFPKDVHPLPGGAISWSGGVLGAVAFEDSISNCAIYIYKGGQLDASFTGAPCTFQGPVALLDGRKSVVPDVVYKIELYLPNRGAMVSERVAFYYDAEKNTFCESQELASWYLNGANNRIPDLQDGQCIVGAVSVEGQ